MPQLRILTNSERELLEKSVPEKTRFVDVSNVKPEIVQTSDEPMSDKEWALFKRVQEHMQKNRFFGFVQGAYGDMEKCEGMLESVTTPPEGGTFMKYFGCSYLAKGFPANEVVEAMGLAKALISLLPREILARSIVLSSALLILFLFAKKRFYYYANVYIEMIYERTVRKLGMQVERYNQFAKELARSTELAIKREVPEFEKPLTYVSPAEASTDKGLRLPVLIAKLSGFICFFLEHDNAYRFRVQDALGCLNKENVKKSIIGEVRRLFGILKSRENSQYGIREKWERLEKLIVPFLYVSRTARRIARNTLLEIDIDKIKLDEDDWYFCLRRRAYNFKGVSLEDRLREKDRIDIEKDHVFLKFVYTQSLATTQVKTATTTV